MKLTFTTYDVIATSSCNANDAAESYDDFPHHELLYIMQSDDSQCTQVLSHTISWLRVTSLDLTLQAGN